MMAGARWPVMFDAEYRGREAEGGSFTAEDTGEVREYGPSFRFEYTTPDGDVVLVSLRSGGRTEEAADFDLDALKKGDFVRVEGLAVMAERGSNRDSYFQPTRIVQIKASERLASAA